MGKPIITLYDDGDNEIELPTRWEICSTCHGEGKHSLRFGAITQSDIDNDWDPDSFDAYMRGDYDAACADCDGTGKVKVVDVDRITPEQRQQLDDAYEGEALDRAEREAEMRMCYGVNY